MLDKIAGDTYEEDIYNPLAPDFDEPSESRVNRVKVSEQGTRTNIGASACFGDKSKRLEVIPEKTDDPFLTHGKDVEHREEGTHPGVGAYDLLNDRQPKLAPHLIDNPLYQVKSESDEALPKKATTIETQPFPNLKTEVKTAVTELLQDCKEISQRPPPEAEPGKKEESKRIVIYKVKESSMFASKSGRLGAPDDADFQNDMNILELDFRGAKHRNSKAGNAKLLSRKNLTPGPGDYITEKTPSKRILIPTSRAFIKGRLPQEKRFDYDEPKLAVERKILFANPGPGQYSTSSTLVKKTFNVTYGATCRVTKSQKGKRNKIEVDQVSKPQQSPLSLDMKSHQVSLPGK